MFYALALLLRFFFPLILFPPLLDPVLVCRRSSRVRVSFPRIVDRTEEATRRVEGREGEAIIRGFCRSSYPRDRRLLLFSIQWRIPVNSATRVSFNIRIHYDAHITFFSAATLNFLPLTEPLLESPSRNSFREKHGAQRSLARSRARVYVNKNGYKLVHATLSRFECFLFPETFFPRAALRAATVRRAAGRRKKRLNE